MKGSKVKLEIWYHSTKICEEYFHLIYDLLPLILRVLKKAAGRVRKKKEFRSTAPAKRIFMSCLKRKGKEFTVSTFDRDLHFVIRTDRHIILLTNGTIYQNIIFWTNLSCVGQTPSTHTHTNTFWVAGYFKLHKSMNLKPFLQEELWIPAVDTSRMGNTVSTVDKGAAAELLHLLAVVLEHVLLDQRLSDFFCPPPSQ